MSASAELLVVILVTHPQSYTKTTDRCDLVAKVEVKTGAIVNNSEFCSVGGNIPKQHFFAFLRYPSTILRAAYRKQFYPKSMVPMESRDFEGVPFASLSSLDSGESVTRHRTIDIV